MVSMVVANDNIAVCLFDTVLTSYMQSPKSLAYAKTIVQIDVLYTLLIKSTATSGHVLFFKPMDCVQHAYGQIVYETQEAMWAAHSNARKLQ